MLHLATDVLLYMEAMAEGMDAMSEFSFVTESRWRREDLNVQTKYERKWLGQGKPIFYGDWQKIRAGKAVPFERQPAPIINVSRLPEARWYGAGRHQAKVFPPRQNATEQCGFYLIDRETGISTPGIIDTQTKQIRLKGAWTPWKIKLMTAIFSEKHP